MNQILINDINNKYILAVINNNKLSEINIDLSALVNTTISFILSSIFAFFIAKYTLKKTNQANDTQRKLTLNSTAIGLLNEIIYNKRVVHQIINTPQLTAEKFNLLISNLSFELFTSFPSEILEFLKSKDQIDLLNIYHETKIHQLNVSSEEELEETLSLLIDYQQKLQDFEKKLINDYKITENLTSQE